MYNFANIQKHSKKFGKVYLRSVWDKKLAKSAK